MTPVFFKRTEKEEILMIESFSPRDKGISYLYSFYSPLETGEKVRAISQSTFDYLVKEVEKKYPLITKAEGEKGIYQQIHCSDNQDNKINLILYKSKDQERHRYNELIVIELGEEGEEL